MASRMFYLGFTGEAYRIALIDTACMSATSVPVKDCPVLHDIPLVNCTVVNGMPKLKALNKWDGFCREDNWYILGTLTSQQAKRKSYTATSCVCINSVGVVSVVKLTDIQLLRKKYTYVQCSSAVGLLSITMSSKPVVGATAVSKTSKYKENNLVEHRSCLPDIKSYVSSVLVEVGVPAKLIGYTYLRDCILEILSDTSLVYSVTKEVYPRIAERYTTNASSVERAIQHAITVAWRFNGAKALNTLFGCTVYSTDKRPSNCNFIALLVDKLRSEVAS